VREKDKTWAKALDDALLAFAANERPLPGITNEIERQVFVEQLIESQRRVEYIAVIRNRDISPSRIDPANPNFDPIRAAIWFMREGDIDEACWLVFLFVHFGKNLKGGWRLIRDIYGSMGGNQLWNWERISNDPEGFRHWLAGHIDQMKNDGIVRGFGNHRKYESLDPWKPVGTGAAVQSYVEWTGTTHSHQQLFDHAYEETEGDPRMAFDWLYKSMDPVMRFGRTARFDYLTMLGKLGLANVEPGSTYMNGATGPFSGATLLFCGPTAGTLPRKTLDGYAIALGDQLKVNMQVMEDALCNWQKSPDDFKAFRG
jgi:hypothetical protein